MWGMDVPIPQSLIDLLGEPFIEYVLGTDDVRIGLSGPQQAMAEQLAGLMTPGVIEESEFARALDLARKFSAYLPDAGQTGSSHLTGVSS